MITMKTKYIYLILLMQFVALGCIAQSPFQKAIRNDVLRGKENEYIYEEYENKYFIENTKNIFSSKNANYDLQPGESRPFVVVEYKGESNKKIGKSFSEIEKNNKKIKESFSEVLEAVFKESIIKTNEASSVKDEVFIGLRSDLTGVIKDVYFYFPIYLEFAVEDIELFEKEIKRKFKLNFVIDQRNKNALYMSTIITVPLQPIREKRAAKK